MNDLFIKKWNDIRTHAKKKLPLIVTILWKLFTVGIIVGLVLGIFFWDNKMPLVTGILIIAAAIAIGKLFRIPLRYVAAFGLIVAIAVFSLSRTKHTEQQVAVQKNLVTVPNIPPPSAGPAPAPLPPHTAQPPIVVIKPSVNTPAPTALAVAPKATSSSLSPAPLAPPLVGEKLDEKGLPLPTDPIRANETITTEEPPPFPTATDAPLAAGAAPPPKIFRPEYKPGPGETPANVGRNWDLLNITVDHCGHLSSSLILCTGRVGYDSDTPTEVAFKEGGSASSSSRSSSKSSLIKYLAIDFGNDHKQKLSKEDNWSTFTLRFIDPNDGTSTQTKITLHLRLRGNSYGDYELPAIHVD